MDNMSQSDKNEILRLLGSIVFASQSAEISIKSFLPYLKSNAKRAKKRTSTHKKRTLGDLARLFASTLSGDEDLLLQLKEELARVVSDRNRVTHHFFEAYESDLLSGNSGSIIMSLQSILSNTQAFGSAMSAISTSVRAARTAPGQDGGAHAEIVIFGEDRVAS